MSAALAVIFLALNVRKFGGAMRPVVTFTPNWGNVLQGDSVTLTCDVPTTEPEEPPTYSWYKDHQPIPGDHRTRHISLSRLEDSGDYQCRTSASDISDPVYLNVTINHLILQRPPSAIYEGDPLTLRCRHAFGIDEYDVRYYRDNVEIKSEFPDSELHIHKVDPTTAGHYKCTKLIRFPGNPHYYNFSDEFSLSVKELFSPPKITVTPYRVMEGGEMTVTCDTRLDLLRANMELRFAFYKDGRPVQEFDASDTYRVRSARLEDSGNYTCDVRTASDTVRKTSDGVTIKIYSRLLVIILAVTIVGVLLVIALSAVIIWRFKKRKESSASRLRPPQQTTAMVSESNSVAEDVCYTYLELGHVPKGNKNKNDDLTVTYATVKNPDI